MHMHMHTHLHMHIYICLKLFAEHCACLTFHYLT